MVAELGRKCLFLRLMYVFQRVTEESREGGLACSGSLPKWPRWQSLESGAVSESPRSTRGPCTWAIFHCFPICIRRELSGKWNSQSPSQYSRGLQCHRWLQRFLCSVLAVPLPPLGIAKHTRAGRQQGMEAERTQFPPTWQNLVSYSTHVLAPSCQLQEKRCSTLRGLCQPREPLL